MNKIEIGTLFEQVMIDAVTNSLEKKMTATDLGITLDDENRQVYRSHFSIELNIVRDTPVKDCKDSLSPVKVRQASDRRGLEILATELLGLLE